ncbi:hypothetical protein HYE82_36700, partial [Streptomyces sp. BR123]|uniref:hypothetical protein n=1 Tax=Streptomyces sp. BR123 TaxID=2749828 RepID=UPI0015C463E2
CSSSEGVADFRAAADTLRAAALAARPGARTVPLPVNAAHAIANWLDDAGLTAEDAGAPDPIALIAALQILYPDHALASGALDHDEADGSQS